MAYYYYLGAQLPYLFYGQTAPMPSMEFKEMALNSLNSGDARDLFFCTLDPVMAEQLSEAKVSSEFIKSWHNWEEVLRLNLFRLRGQKLKRDTAEQREAPELPADAAAVAKAAINMDSPLEAELFLDKARWNAIETFEGINYFSEKMIFAYLLKLQLMERRQAFNTEEGFTEYKTLYASILENAGEPK